MQSRKPLQREFHSAQALPDAEQSGFTGNEPKSSESSMHYIFNPHNYPRKRAAIACEICRVRKTRCDATKPSCASCAELGVVCSYRKLVPDSRCVTCTAFENLCSFARPTLLDRPWLDFKAICRT